MRVATVICVILLVCGIALVGVGYCLDRQGAPIEAPDDSDRNPHIEVALNERELYLVGGVVEEWIKGETTALELNNIYREHGDTYAAQTVEINWGIFDIPEGSFIQRQHFDLSTDADFQQMERFDLRAGERNVELYNLLVDTQYYFRITVELENSQGCTIEESFTTKWSPRIIDLENLKNIRDIGGWKTTDGKTVKQELFYRGCELDGATDGKYLITEAGAEVMQSDLGIKTELDLRSAYQEGVQDKLGQGVRHQFFDLPSYDRFFSDEGGAALKQIFDVLSNEENYPVYLHCSYGTSRTATVCYVLESLLGMSREDCYREWELSILATGSGVEAMESFISDFQALEGETQQLKAENYLLSIGVTQDQIDTIRTILVG